MVVGPADAGAQAGPAWEVAAWAGSLRVDDDLDAGRLAGWGPVFGASIALSPDPRVALALEAWRHSLTGDTDPSFDPAPGAEPPRTDDAVWSAGVHLVAIPLGGRPAVEPTLQFGLETVRADDDEDRGVAFVSGAGLRGRMSARWSARLDVRNHFLTVDEGEVDGIGTGRDASLWELRAGIGWRIGGGR